MAPTRPAISPATAGLLLGAAAYAVAEKDAAPISSSCRAPQRRRHLPRAGPRRSQQRFAGARGAAVEAPNPASQKGSPS